MAATALGAASLYHHGLRVQYPEADRDGCNSASNNIIIRLQAFQYPEADRELCNAGGVVVTPIHINLRMREVFFVVME